MISVIKTEEAWETTQKIEGFKLVAIPGRTGEVALTEKKLSLLKEAGFILEVETTSEMCQEEARDPDTGEYLDYYVCCEKRTIKKKLLKNGVEYYAEYLDTSYEVKPGEILIYHEPDRMVTKSGVYVEEKTTGTHEIFEVEFGIINNRKAGRAKKIVKVFSQLMPPTEADRNHPNRNIVCCIAGATGGGDLIGRNTEEIMKALADPSVLKWIIRQDYLKDITVRKI